MTEFLNNILFIFQRLNWLSVIDIALVTLTFYSLLYLVRDTQAMVLLRGIIFLIVLQRLDNLNEYINTGVAMDSRLTSELLLQIFYPNTPLHDGAVIVKGNRIAAGACVMPLSASGILVRSPDRQMGLRHRAALGISEVSDAITVVVSEETGSISIAHAGRMIRRLDPDRLENILNAFYRPEQRQRNFFQRHFPYLFPRQND